MKKYFQTILFCLTWVIFFTACSQKEDAVIPLSGEICDTMATVQLVPGCGLLLVLENNQKLIPLNTTVSTGPADAPVYKIDDFEVQVGQRVIVGYKTAQVKAAPSPCNQSGYHTNPLVDITCIVSLENRL